MTTPTQTPSPDRIRAAWDALAPGFDRHVTPFTQRFGEQILTGVGIAPGTRFLDVAAGSGALALPAARRGARVVAVDISPVMTDRLAARARAEGLREVRAAAMDGEHLELDDDSFDVSASLNGVSVIPGLERGLAEMARVTRPGGTVLVAAFAQPVQAEFIAWPVGALRAAVPGFTGLPSDPPPLPFRLADPERMARMLRAAGLTEVMVHQTTLDTPFASPDELLGAFRSGHPVGAQLLAGVTEEQLAEARQVLDGMFRERSGGHPDAVLHCTLNTGTGTVPRT